VVRKYQSKFGIIAGVTPAIEALHSSNVSLGERFLKYRVSTHHKADTSRQIIHKALSNIKHNDDMRNELAGIGSRILNQSALTINSLPEIPVAMLEKITGLATWVAGLRGVVSREKYTGMLMFKPMTEIGTRLAKQFAKLMLGISLYRGESMVSEATLGIIVSVAQHTAPDRVEEIVKQMFIMGCEDYIKTDIISEWCKLPLETTRHILSDLMMLNLMEKSKMRGGGWKLAPNTIRLMMELNLYADEVDWTRRNRISKPRRIK
jgi:hypothetical protein